MGDLGEMGIGFGRVWPIGQGSGGVRGIVRGKISHGADEEERGGLGLIPTRRGLVGQLGQLAQWGRSFFVVVFFLFLLVLLFTFAF